MIKVISFDIGGTLLCDNENSTIKKYDLKSLALLVGLPYEVVRSAYKKVFQKNKGSFDDLVNMFCDILNIENSGKLQMFFYNKFNYTVGKISEDNLNIIKKLKQIGYKVILFSNTCCLVKNNFEHEFLNNIDEVFYSYDLGYTKNDNESYKLVESKMGFLPEEFLHIGDTLKSDYINPIKNGWNALYYGENFDDNVTSITDLNEVFNYLSNKNKIL